MRRQVDLERAGLLRELIQAGVQVLEFKEQQRRLEEAFIDLVEHSRENGKKSH